MKKLDVSRAAAPVLVASKPREVAHQHCEAVEHVFDGLPALDTPRIRRLRHQSVLNVSHEILNSHDRARVHPLPFR